MSIVGIIIERLRSLDARKCSCIENLLRSACVFMRACFKAVFCHVLVAYIHLKQEHFASSRTVLSKLERLKPNHDIAFLSADLIRISRARLCIRVIHSTHAAGIVSIHTNNNSVESLRMMRHPTADLMRLCLSQALDFSPKYTNEFSN